MMLDFLKANNKNIKEYKHLLEILIENNHNDKKFYYNNNYSWFEVKSFDKIIL